ncbi:MAG TPA: STAS domain-containing protein [Spirochaetota bacterium]|nr:STAS domain-containing protein [Spirochaetota bacterium]HPC41247.1 STAS domain-containing protein [Spirochaetota bacterium]HPL15714.1 STAS domain-containing protein [Spirochaetota bacterium]HQF08141.1 STAS domain-containing protein [Spirochaetota bacterium]HQH96972.1 STAS domain-containing protein [Spirochaetota bacterium]
MVHTHVEQFGDIAVIHIEGIFNIDSLTKVEYVWMAQIRKMPRVIAINCQKLESLDSSAIGFIVKFFNYAMGQGIMLVFYDLNPLLQKLFATAKLDRYFNITSRSDFENRYVLQSAPSMYESFEVV